MNVTREAYFDPGFRLREYKKWEERPRIALSLINNCTVCTWKSESLKLHHWPLTVLMLVYWSFCQPFMVTEKKHHLGCHQKQVSVWIAVGNFQMQNCSCYCKPMSTSVRQQMSLVFWKSKYSQALCLLEERCISISTAIYLFLNFHFLCILVFCTAKIW